MQTMKKLAAVTAITTLFSSPLWANKSVDDITACMQANLPQSFSVEEVTLISESAEGSRAVISGEIYFSRQDRHGEIAPARAMMKLQQPAALRDSAYLVVESEEYARSGMFVYLPAVSRVRRVSGEMADGRLFGTDITYYDFKQLRSAMADMQPEYVEFIDGERPAHLLRFSPQGDENVGYEHVMVSLDDESCLPTHMDFYSADHIVKTFDVPVQALRQDGKRWYPTEFTLQDKVYNTQTTMKTSGFRSGNELSEKLFHPATFYR